VWILKIFYFNKKKSGVKFDVLLQVSCIMAGKLNMGGDEI